MIGYLKPDFSGKSHELKREYKAYYCGLCKALKKNYGYSGIISLSYEITALLILLGSLKDKKEIKFSGSCVISPFVPVKYIDYYQEEFKCASNISILITHFEIKDNVYDEGTFKWKLLELLTNKRGYRAINCLGEDYTTFEKSLLDYYSIEREGLSDFNELLIREGELVKNLSALLINQVGINAKELLLEISSLLGQWIYLVDACNDYYRDIKNKSFNPIFYYNLNEVDKIIEKIESDINTIIVQLPIKNNIDLVQFLFVDNLKTVSKKYLLQLSSKKGIRQQNEH